MHYFSFSSISGLTFISGHNRLTIVLGYNNSSRQSLSHSFGKIGKTEGVEVEELAGFKAQMFCKLTSSISAFDDLALKYVSVSYYLKYQYRKYLYLSNSGTYS